MIINEHTRYAGFWRRLAATLIDSLLLSILMGLLLYAVYGGEYFAREIEGGALFAPAGAADVFINHILPLILAVVFWVKWMGTPGKLLLGCRVVDATTGNALTIGQSVGRYFAYLVSIIPLCLGFLWIAWDKRKQGFHDKLANTVVVIEDAANLTLEELEKGLK